MSDVGTGKDSEATEVSVARDETSRRFTRFFRHSLRYALSLGVNLLSREGNSQTGHRMLTQLSGFFFLDSHCLQWTVREEESIESCE